MRRRVSWYLISGIQTGYPDCWWTDMALDIYHSVTDSLIDDLKVNWTCQYLYYPWPRCRRFPWQTGSPSCTPVKLSKSARQKYFNPQHPLYVGAYVPAADWIQPMIHLYSIPGGSAECCHTPKYICSICYAWLLILKRNQRVLQVSDTHYAAWLLHHQAPAIAPPAEICPETNF